MSRAFLFSRYRSCRSLGNPTADTLYFSANSHPVRHGYLHRALPEGELPPPVTKSPKAQSLTFRTRTHRLRSSTPWYAHPRLEAHSHVTDVLLPLLTLLVKSSEEPKRVSSFRSRCLAVPFALLTTPTLLALQFSPISVSARRRARCPRLSSKRPTRLACSLFSLFRSRQLFRPSSPFFVVIYLPRSPVTHARRSRCFYLYPYSCQKLDS